MQYDKADQQNCPRRVVFYGRVSTELEAQISALKNQMNWYLELAEHHPNWTVVGQYADEGISGTGMKTRPSFMKMLRDARKKKFDLIVTREVSRFARNTVDTLVTTRELKQYGVEVYFVNDDIWTMRGDGEVRLTIMASLAQDESRKMSERTKAGIQTSQKKGTYVAGPTPFGYKRDKKAHTLVVQESQAETVRKIFAWYADGINGTEIAQTLTQEGALPCSRLIRSTRMHRFLESSACRSSELHQPTVQLEYRMQSSGRLSATSNGKRYHYFLLRFYRTKR